jgi:phage protein D
VTAIKEANDLITLNLTTLFEKLEEHQHEFMALEKYEKTIKEKKHSEKYKMKPIALKESSSRYNNEKYDDSSLNDKKWDGEDNMTLLVLKYHKYIKRNGVEYSDENFIRFRNQTNNQGKAKGWK